MISVDLSTREYDGHVIVALRGELDIADAVNVAAALAAVAAREPEIIVDLAGLEFIDSSGVGGLAPRAHLLASQKRGRGRVPRAGLATRALGATERRLTGRFAGPGTSGPAKRGVATGRTGKCRSPPVTGVPANPAWQAATQPMRCDL